MRFQPIAGGMVPSGSVCGLGVTDALRLELAPVQLRWLIDELEEVRGPLEEQLQRERARCADAPDELASEQLDATEHELQLLRMMRAQLPASDRDGTVAFVGPTGMVLDLVRGTMRNVVQALSELVRGEAIGDPDWHDRVGQTAEAATAWVKAFLDLDCEAVELFRFDPESDPIRTR
jgi:hypothetical protein